MELKISDLLDEYVDNNIPMDLLPVPDNKRIKEVAMKRIRKRNVRPLRVALIAAAIVVLLTGTVLGVYYAKMTVFLKDNWNEAASIDMTQEHVEYIEERSADIGESVTDQGVTVTVESVTCTSDMVYLMYRFDFDPEMYDLDNIASCTDALTSVWAENGEHSTVCSTGSSGGEKRDGSIYVNHEIMFEKLPEGAVLNDGKTILHIEMNTIWPAYLEEEIPEIKGTWNFEFLLPEAENTETVFADAEMIFDCGVNLFVTNVEVNESGCSFVAEADSYDYFFTDSLNAELARAAEPGMAQITVEAKLQDGTVIPSNGANASYDEELDAEVWKIRWSAPLDPATVESLVFSDGITEYYIEMK